MPWRKPWARVAPQSLASGKAYRGINPFLLVCAGFGSPFWLTYRQAKEFGGHVKRGEKATRILFWKMYERERAADDVEDGEATTLRLPVARAYSVFNLEQCVDIPAEKVPSIEQTVFEPIAAAERVVAQMPNRPAIHHDATGALYRPNSDSIHLPRPEYFDQRESYYSVLYHELTHSTGHKDRLDRGLSTNLAPYGSRDYSQEELVAEMGAAFLCAHTGITPATIENSAAYINGLLHRLDGDHKLVVVAAAQAQKAADYMLRRSIDRT